MADFPAQQVVPNDFGFSQGAEGPIAAQLVAYVPTQAIAGDVPSQERIRNFYNNTVIFFKMRARANPGPAYLTWIVQSTPDFLGVSAPGPIFPGTAVISDTWTTG